MLPDLTSRRVRHPLRFRSLQVRDVQHPTPHLARITLAGDDLEGFVSLGFDDHVKLFFPDPVTGILALPTAGPEGPVWPEGTRPTMRDYTPRHFDPVGRTLQIDFALHQPGGPATEWAAQARVGQTLGVGGPRGSLIVPTEFDWHLLVGDDTALPAIARRLAELSAAAHAEVVVEVDSPADCLPLRRITLRSGVFHAWVGCESAQAKALRAYLVGECLVNPQFVRASSYWRRGSADAHETLDA
jgi:NADPH-dependent ferric siderophore reductase